MIVLTCYLWKIDEWDVWQGKSNQKPFCLCLWSHWSCTLSWIVQIALVWKRQISQEDWNSHLFIVSYEGRTGFILGIFWSLTVSNNDSKKTHFNYVVLSVVWRWWWWALTVLCCDAGTVETTTVSKLN